MTEFHSIHHEHARLAEDLERVRAATRVIRDDGVFDPAGYRELCRFINEVALPHLKHEEDEIFPRAAALGLEEEVLALLRRDHEQLRVLSRMARAWGLDPNAAVLPHDGAMVVDRFVRAFDAHARHEEAIFSELERGSGQSLTDRSVKAIRLR